MYGVTHGMEYIKVWITIPDGRRLNASPCEDEVTIGKVR